MLICIIALIISTTEACNSNWVDPSTRQDLSCFKTDTTSTPSAIGSTYPTSICNAATFCYTIPSLNYRGCASGTTLEVFACTLPSLQSVWGSVLGSQYGVSGSFTFRCCHSGDFCNHSGRLSYALLLLAAAVASSTFVA